MLKLKEFKTSEIGKIPDDWKLIHLNEIVDINPETIDKDYSFEDIQYIDIGSVENYQIKKYESFKLSERPSRAQRIVRKNDIIVSTVRPYLHGFTKIVDSKPSLICSTGFAVLRSKDLRTVDFIFNFIKSQYFESQLNTHMTGLAYPAVTSKIVGNTILGYPKSINEIEKIGTILSNVNKLIQKIEQIIEQTQKLKKGLMQKLLTKGIGHTKFKNTKFGEIPEEWEAKTLVDICNTVRDGSHFSPKHQDIGFPLATVTNMKDNYIDIDSCYKISKEDYDLLVKNGCKLESEDVLFSKDGTVGLSLVYNQNKPLVVLSSIAIIRPKKEILNPYFTKYVLQSEVILGRILGARTGTALRRIILKDLRKIIIPIPQLKEQQKIISILSTFDLSLENYNNYKLKIENLKKGLMQELLTGKIRVKV